MKKIFILLLILCLVGIGFGGFVAANAAEGEPGSSPDNPIVVSTLEEIPAEAALTAVLNDDCSTTTTGVLTVPATDDTTHQEFRYLREVPGQEEVSHTEYLYQREVVDYKTQYHFRKFTHTKYKTPDVEAVWANFSPDRQQGPFTGPPTWPNDDRGTWHVHHQIPPGQAGPDGVYSTSDSQGRASWFYRQAGVEGTWGDYGPWTPWVPETHTSWEDSDAPLGVPQFHGQGDDWYREWQAMFDGQTRQVENGSHTETSEWLTEPPAGEGWVQVDNRQVVDQEATEGYTEYYVLGGEPSLNEEDASWILAEQAPEGWTQFDERTVSNEDGTPEVVTYYSYNDGVECDKPHEPPTHNPPVKHHNPPAPNTPSVPTLIDAGL